MNNPEPHPFIRYLQNLAEGQNRGALASLRRGLGQPPGTAAEMYRYVEPFLGADARYKEDAYYLVAALFALHPESTDFGDMGSHMAAARAEGNEDALERRFTALLAAHPDDLPDYLRQAVSFLKSKDIPINWNELLRDLQGWGREDRFVQKKWARSFWGGRQLAKTETQSSEEKGE